MEDILKRIMAHESQYPVTAQNIIDYIKYSIKTPHKTAEYDFLQSNPDATKKELTIKQLATFYRNVADTMVLYYKDKEINVGVDDFFSMYNQLGANQSKEKEMLAYNFFLASPKDKENYPFHYVHPEGKAWGSYFEFVQDGVASAMNALTNERFDRWANMEVGLSDEIRDCFIHLYPFGHPGNIAKRIYVNTTPRNATSIATELFRKCSAYPGDENYRPYVKFTTRDRRNDTMLTYCTEKNFDIMLDLMLQICREHKEWFNGTCKLPLVSKVYAPNQHLLFGIADEPTKEGGSFNDTYCSEVIIPFKVDLRKKLGVENLNTLPTKVIDEYVTYDNLKPYIEKTCYSVDYPFLTKETVMNKKLQFEKTL